MSLINSTKKISRWISPLQGKLLWQPCPEIDSFQGQDIMGEVGRGRRETWGKLDGKSLSAAWLLCLG